MHEGPNRATPEQRAFSRAKLALEDRAVALYTKAEELYAPTVDRIGSGEYVDIRPQLWDIIDIKHVKQALGSQDLHQTVAYGDDVPNAREVTKYEDQYSAEDAREAQLKQADFTHANSTGMRLDKASTPEELERIAVELDALEATLAALEQKLAYRKAA